jgi:hypothetical protein
MLTAHEFLTRAKAPDYPKIDISDPGYDFREGRGKRIFLDAAQGIAAKPVTPHDNTTDANSIYVRIRERQEQGAKSGTAFSTPLARRNLFRAFERYDREKLGVIPAGNFYAALDRDVGIIMTGHIQRILLAKFANGDGKVAYPKMVMEVYPANAAVPAWKIRADQAQSPHVSKSRAESRSRLSKSQFVNTTGSYWQTQLPAVSPTGRTPQSGSAKPKGLNSRPGSRVRASSTISRPGSRVPSQIDGEHGGYAGHEFQYEEALHGHAGKDTYSHMGAAMMNKGHEAGKYHVYSQAYKNKDTFSNVPLGSNEYQSHEPM